MAFFTMNTLHKSIALFFPLVVLLVFSPVRTTGAEQSAASPTPTYDPLVEPPLPENPTEYEWGRNLYWHWCMTCHGDKGQGLTDEFRSIWEEDHQNCWGRGCHAGHPGDMGFPIPTVVPALVDESHLAQFASVQALSEFLKATHPPQSPGILKVEEYHAIAAFVFVMNARSLDTPLSPTVLPITATAPWVATLIPEENSQMDAFPLCNFVVLSVVIVGIFILLLKIRHSH